MPDQPTLVKARALCARLRRLTALTSVACPAFDGHALMAQRERYAAPRFRACVAADKFAPFSGKSLDTAEAPSSLKIPTETNTVAGIVARRPLRLFAANNSTKGAPEEIRTPDPQIRSLVLNSSF